MTEIPADIMAAAETTFLVAEIKEFTPKERAELIGVIARALLAERKRSLGFVIYQTSKFDGTPCCPREDWKPKQREFFDEGQRQASRYLAMVIGQILDRNVPLEG